MNIKTCQNRINFGASYQELILSIKSAIFSLSLFFLCGAGIAQPVLETSFYYYNSETEKKHVFSMEKQQVDSLLLDKAINQRLQQLYEKGYLGAMEELIFTEIGKADVFFYTNEIFATGKLSVGNVDEEIINKIGFSSTSFNERPFSHQRVVRLLQSILDYAENSGYPFASIKLDSISIIENTINAELDYQSGPMIVFDSLVISGSSTVKSSYLMAYLGLYKDKPYEEKLIEGIAAKMQLLPFVELAENPEISIVEEKCIVHLNLTKKDASSMDGILGILPNQKQGNGMLITGQVNLDLKNLFASGKNLALEWQGYDAKSQLLNVLYFHPNLFKTPLNVEGGFDLLKQDTTFLQREFDVELSLIAKNSGHLGFRTEFISSRLISTADLENIVELPENTDYNLNYYGLNYRLRRYDNINFPSRGYGLKMNGSVGQKKIIQNPSLSQEVYQDVDFNSVQYKWTGELDSFFPVYRNILLRAELSGGYLQGNKLFMSDLFRIGGLRTLRGFAENHFYTSKYGVATVEFRALFSNETYFMLFYDQGALSGDEFSDGKVQYPFGTGAGFSFATNAGVFNFVLAMGKSKSQPFGFDHAKIHFGYVSRF